MGMLVLVLTVVHQQAHRRVGAAGHLHEVEVELAGDDLSFEERADAELLSAGSDQQHLAGADLVVDPGLGTASVPPVVSGNASLPGCLLLPTAKKKRVPKKHPFPRDPDAPNVAG